MPVIPREHHENLHDLPAPVGHALWDLTQRVATASPQERAPYAERLAAALDLPRTFG